MTDFDYEVMMKKRLANQARHKKGTKGRKGCRLPSDYLTEKEKKAMNGEVKTVQLGVPTKWEEFKKLSNYLKLEYLNAIKEKYHPSISQYAEMFGASKAAVQAGFYKLGFKTGGGFGNGAKSRADEKLWAEFIRKTDIPEIPAGEENKTDPLSEKEAVAVNNALLVIGAALDEKLEQLDGLSEEISNISKKLDEMDQKPRRLAPPYANYCTGRDEKSETTPNSLNVSFRGVTFDEVCEKLKPLLGDKHGCFRIEFGENYLSPTYILKRDEEQ